MNELKTLEDFYKVLCNVEVPDRARDIASDDPAKEGSADLFAFASYALEALESESWTSQPHQVFFRRKLGQPLREVALPAYSIMEEEGALHLFSFHWDNTEAEPRVIEQRVIERERQKLRALVDTLRDPRTALESIDDPAVPHLKAIADFVRSERFKVLKCFVITNQRKNERARAEKTTDGKVVNEVVDIEKLFRWVKGVASRSEIEVTVSELLGPDRLLALRAPDTNEEVTTYLAVLPGRFLAELYENYDNRLLELNVRSYLSAKGGVNKGIQNTLKDARERSFFLPYNNGIVMVVEELAADDVSPGVADIRWMRGIQIVNGGQTTASLFKARRDARGDDPLQNVYVQAKIVRLNRKAPADEIVRSISQFANRQNKVEMADLGANEAFHRRVEKLAEKELDPRDGRNWFYERMRNSYATQLMLESSAASRRKWQAQHPKDRVVTKTDLAKYLIAWDRQPWIVAKGSQKCFDAFAQSHHVKPIRTDESAETEITSDRFKEIIGRVILYRTTHQLVRADRESFTSNQINVATYTVSYLSRRVAGQLDWKAIWRNQGLSDDLKALLKAFARRVSEVIDRVSQGRLASEVCKREGLFDELCRQLGDLPLPVDAMGAPVEPVELRGYLDRGEDPVDPEDELIISEVLSYPMARIEALRRAADSNSDVLPEPQRGVIHNLSELALQGWTEKPKPKQAKMFLSAVATLENYGLIEAS